MEKILVSACLLGMNCRYDGGNSERPAIKELLKEYDIIPFCPEVFGGLPTPRKKSGIRHLQTNQPATGKNVWEGHAKVYSESDEDVTELFLKGAHEALKLAKMFNINKAYLKAGSPSCGVSTLSCFDNIIHGSGVCACYLEKNGIIIIEKN